MPTARLLRAIFVLLAAQRGVAAQQVIPPLRHWQHSAWTAESGLPSARIHPMVKGPDGYLWLGGENSLIRFDGSSYIVFDSANSPLLKSAVSGLIVPQFVGPDSSIWFSRADDALITLKDGRFSLIHSPETGVGSIVVDDGLGRRWLTGSGRELRVLKSDRAERVPWPAGLPRERISRVARDTGEGLWLGMQSHGLWHVVGDRATLVADLPGPVRPFLQDRRGTLWVTSPATGLRRLVGGKLLPPGLPWDAATPTTVVDVRADRAGAIWFATTGRGLLREMNGTFEQFGRDEGLSDISVSAIAPDDGGGMWLSTTDGAIERLRPTPFVTIGKGDALPWVSATSMAEDEAGGLWARGPGDSRIRRLRGGIFDRTATPSTAATLDVPITEPVDVVGTVRGGGVWLGPSTSGLVKYHDGKFERWTVRDGLPPHRVWLAHEARDGSVWLSILGGGLGRIRNGRYVDVPLPGVEDAMPRAMAEDSRGNIWIGDLDSTLVFQFTGDSVMSILGKRDGLPAPLSHLTVAAGDTMWGSTDSGLVRIANGAVKVVHVPALAENLRRDPVLVVSGRDLFLTSEIGMARVSLHALNAAANGGRDSIPIRFLEPWDGVATPRRATYYRSLDVRGRDGRVWSATPSGLVVYDPDSDVADGIAPVVRIDGIWIGDRRATGGDSLVVQAKPERLSVRFGVVTRVLPEHARVQYRLDGADGSWIDAGASRIASYPRLRPGSYTFRVRAWNVDGVASAGEKGLTFRVLPAWYESWWFAVLVALFIALLAVAATIAIQWNRGRRTKQLLKSQYDAALAERVRIAQELHDTLLQGFAGVSLQLKAAELALPDRPAVAAETLARVRVLTAEALREARDGVWDIRTPDLDECDLADALLLRAQATSDDKGPDVRMVVTGNRRRLPLAVEVAAFRIGREAVANAVRHAQARTITTEIDYGANELTIRVLDDGRGFQQSEGDAARRSGHWGLVGMHERARRAGGSCEISRAETGGTRVVAVLPCGAAPGKD